MDARYRGYATLLPARAASPVSPEWGNSGAEGVNGRATVQVAAAGASGVV
ncbi:hypothetical protein [Amycolatopsis taiwanensis]|uniref:Uncharacterized protein n=1 Tax=Amycolatopsis taiwanensis TaxID=342230 RepID=A0A9W6VDK8_9PSEU|nr:hypothetical protein [Amycolatopsis taiwanensis]GLY63562.1 hypothetical protein Atai01_01810 [Amycolatopsis taiwanensis]